MEVNTTRRQQSMTIARRLITIALTDFLCWCPVGLLGALSSAGVRIPAETNVALVTFVIPINSAINPLLYTVNSLLQHRKEKQLQTLRDYLKNYCQ